MGENLGSEYTKAGIRVALGSFRRPRWSRVGGIQIQGDNAVGLTSVHSFPDGLSLWDL